MQIFLRPPNPEALSFEVDFQIQQAIVALRRSVHYDPRRRPIWRRLIRHHTEARC